VDCQFVQPALYPELTAIAVTVAVYNSLVVAYAEQNRLASAEKHARDMGDKGLGLDKTSYECLVRASLNTGQSRRAHQWGLEMNAAGFRKPNISLMRSLICALSDAGNTQSANHWLAFMAEIGQPMDQQTYEVVRTVHPLEIVPAALSGEVGRAEPPVVRPACLAGERRLSKTTDGAVQVERRLTPRADVPSARRRTPVLMLAGSSRLQSPLKTGGLAAISCCH